MPLGTDNPLPFRIGGGPTRTQRVYNAMRSAVGQGNRAAPDTAMEMWRRARARGLVAGDAVGRVVTQSISPDLATDMLPFYERILSKQFPEGTADEDKRQALVALWVGAEDAATIQDALQEIDATITVVTTSRDDHREAVPGRFFEDHDPTDPAASGPEMNLTFGGSGPKSASFANFSDAHVLYVRFPHAAGSFPADSQSKLTRIIALLNKALPAWVDFAISLSAGGFVLDTDLLDLTTFG